MSKHRLSRVSSTFGICRDGVTVELSAEFDTDVVGPEGVRLERRLLHHELRADVEAAHRAALAGKPVAWPAPTERVRQLPLTETQSESPTTSGGGGEANGTGRAAWQAAKTRLVKKET